ncbi:MAG: hypothetical protein ACQESP_07255 [Candidatus Muiribacteriota bacterium]
MNIFLTVTLSMILLIISAYSVLSTIFFIIDGVFLKKKKDVISGKS